VLHHFDLSISALPELNLLGFPAGVHHVEHQFQGAFILHACRCWEVMRAHLSLVLNLVACALGCSCSARLSYLRCRHVASAAQGICSGA